ncbi:hypothetical protein SK128_003947 [Halocaridina rubra]|uniref:C-type lectin domain-containing protein n=1 Tax=Halocaridina rubra TaxID=373956 RepID=A0AAN8XAK2_HALRR
MHIVSHTKSNQRVLALMYFVTAGQVAPRDFAVHLFRALYEYGSLSLAHGDQPHRGSCYSFPEELLSWADAVATCETAGAHLVTINDRFEDAFISSQLGEMGYRVWIGMNGTIAEDGAVTFNWVTGEPVDFTNWDEYEPNPEHGVCVSASGHKSSPGLWMIWKCEEAYRFICEYYRDGYNPNTPTTTEPPGVNCAIGWTHKGDRCYKIFQDPLSWGLGEQFCLAYGAHLASINSKDEEGIILAISKNSVIFIDCLI